MFESKRFDPVLAESYRSQSGQTILEVSSERPLLLVFLRHFGCTFCREAVAELESLRGQIEAGGTGLAFVHLGTEPRAAKFFAPYHLDDLPRFADGEGKLYEAFGLARAEFRQYFNRESIFRMLMAWMEGNFIGLPAGDVQRMPGAFLLHRGAIKAAFRHKLVSDRPRYLELAGAA
jgi:peroxiredoxin